MSSTVSIFESIPGPVWGVIGAVAGATLTSITNLISNFGNNKRLSLQLAHDAREKNIDRMSNLRREIYLTAVAEMTKASSYFGKLPHEDPSNQNVAAGLEGLYVAAAKLSLVAPPGTQEAVDSLGVEYWKLTHKVIVALSPMQTLKAEMKLYGGMYDQAMIEVKRVISAMNNLREGGCPDEDVMFGLKDSFDFLSGQADEFSQKRQVATNEFYALCAKYNHELMADMKPLAILQAKVVIAIRQDFGIETDEARMMAHMERQWSTVSEAVDQASSEVV
jgi:hypothetical protein